MSCTLPSKSLPRLRLKNASSDGCSCWIFGLQGIIPEWEPTLAATAPKESNIPDATLVLATEVAALDHATGSVYLMAIAWNLNGPAWTGRTTARLSA